MIEYQKAKELLLKQVPLANTKVLPLEQANQNILAEDIYSKYDHPFFDQSAVDGYLLYHESKNLPLKVVGEIAAGGFSTHELQPNETMRIFTGAQVPSFGNTVVMQEFVDVTSKGNDTFIKINDAKLALGGNIRKRGDQIKKGDVTLKKGTLLTPAAIGFLASIGVQNIKVFRSPKAHIIVTGNEFADINEPILEGKIFESNGIMLQAALADTQINCSYEIAIDELEILEACIAEQSALNDIILITGGVSVGDYDFTRPALENNGFEIVFHKVNQKPGKPILFAKHPDGKYAFGLPGNPRSALIGYYLYVLPFIQKYLGQEKSAIEIKLPVGEIIRRKADGKTHFLSAEISDGKVFINPQQASHMMLSMATADVIAILPPEKMAYEVGELVSCRIV